MIRKILGILDILSGILLLIKPQFEFVRIFAYLMLIKSGWSLFTNYITLWIWDWMGYIDLLSGFSLILIANGRVFFFMNLLAIALIVKGIVSNF